MSPQTADAHGDRARPPAPDSSPALGSPRAGGPPRAAETPFDRATAHLDAPLAVVDLRAFDANAADLVRRSQGKPIRVASKSVRCRALLERVLAREGFAGLMSFTLAESLWLARSGFGDILLAYPTADRAGLAELTAEPDLAAAVTVMVDDPAQLDLIDAARPDGARGGTEVRVCVELDTSFRLPVGNVRVGARRSPLREPAQLAALARAVVSRPGFRLVGLMAYEGHLAGVGDEVAGRPVFSRAVRMMQAAARKELARRRWEAVRAVRAVAPRLEFVNGGGTGSVQHTAAEAAVTEIAAGSGLYVPRLFDNFRSFSGRPAALFAQPVVRRPGPGVVTVLGGGYPASGVAGADRLPVPYLPAGLHYDPQEGPGEVQTPLLGPAADGLRIGDKVWFRHAKAGELCERFAELHLVDGDRVVDTVPTYRGEGHAFL
ncbi:amino acid deaminase/aldolase [Streptomyces sioyaensis]|uniref:amino acid deaminase/aldolase n=1 Tax=Streptomyces sioyaensis TaxID=67364 RepID=UPI00369DFB0B